MSETGKNQNTQPGRMEVITGPMFSGKSEELIRRLKRAQIARLRIASFKPEIDLRYQPDAISSHSAQTIRAVAVRDVDRLRAALFPALDTVDVVGIDEAQFFDELLVGLANEWCWPGSTLLLRASRSPRCRR
jgi:thymidine kinase